MRRWWRALAWGTAGYLIVRVLGLVTVTLLVLVVLVGIALYGLGAFLEWLLGAPRQRRRPLDPQIMCRGEEWLSRGPLAPPDHIATLDTFAEPDRRVLDELSRRVP